MRWARMTVTSPAEAMGGLSHWCMTSVPTPTAIRKAPFLAKGMMLRLPRYLRTFTWANGVNYMQKLPLIMTGILGRIPYRQWYWAVAKRNMIRHFNTICHMHIKG